MVLVVLVGGVMGFGGLLFGLSGAPSLADVVMAARARGSISGRRQLEAIVKHGMVTGV